MACYLANSSQGTTNRISSSKAHLTAPDSRPSPSSEAFGPRVRRILSTSLWTRRVVATKQKPAISATLAVPSRNRLRM
jgi:hypothetical protein